MIQCCCDTLVDDSEDSVGAETCSEYSVLGGSKTCSLCFCQLLWLLVGTDGKGQQCKLGAVLGAGTLSPHHAGSTVIILMLIVDKV